MALLYGSDVVEITVDGRYESQQFVNRYYLVHDPVSAGTDPIAGSSSATLLTNWITRYQANIIPFALVGYSVAFYWLRSIQSVVQVIEPNRPIRYRPVYRRTILEKRAGTVDDVGERVLEVDSQYLPASNALRVFREPRDRVIGGWNSSYIRFGPMQTSDLDITPAADHDQWAAAIVTAAATAWEGLVSNPFADSAADPHWINAIWSMPYWYNTVRPGEGNDATGLAATFSQDVEVVKWVGTQTTRAYRPSGGFRGR